MGLQNKNFPVLYDYNHNKIAILSNSLEVNEQKIFGGLNTLSFKYPKFLLDKHGVPVLDENGNKTDDPKADFVENDYVVKYRDEYYIIKIDNDSRTSNNELFIDVQCHGMAYELQENYVEFLDLTPPANNPVNLTTALSEILKTGQVVRVNKAQSGTSNTITLDSLADRTDDLYNNYKIEIIAGQGAGQGRTITDYNATTKVATVDSTWSTIPNITSVFRIFNPVWELGFVDNQFVNTGGGDTLRSHKFDYSTILKALNDAKEKYKNSSGETGYITYGVVYVGGKWVKQVNLVAQSPYDGAQIRYKKNLTSIKREKNSEQLYTRIRPEGRDNLTIGQVADIQRTDSSVTYYEHQLGHTYIDNFQYFLALGYTYKECVDKFVKEFRLSDALYTDISDLYNDSRDLLNEISVPKITYTISLLDLSRQTGREYESFDVGDTVRVVDEELGINIDTLVSTKTTSEDSPENSSVELTNFQDNLGDFLSRLVKKNEGYTETNKVYGKSTVITVAKIGQFANWRSADVIIPENSADDAVYVQNAINSLAPDGGEVNLLKGNYVYNSYLTIPANVALTSAGGVTITYDLVPPPPSPINVGSIGENTADISFLNGEVQINASNIAGNTSAISVNANQISINASDIAGNTSAIAVNASEISINSSDIAGNTASIAVNASEIALRVEADDVISSINVSPEVIQIQSSRINLVGAVTVLSDITGNLGTITAGTINAVTINGATVNSANIDISEDVTIGNRLNIDGNNFGAGIRWGTSANPEIYIDPVTQNMFLEGGTGGDVYVNGIIPTDNAGDITSVIAGTGLNGGGTSGSVTLSIDTSEVVRSLSGQNITLQYLSGNNTVEVRVAGVYRGAITLV